MGELADLSTLPSKRHTADAQLLSEKDSGILHYSGDFVKLEVPSRPPIPLDLGLSIAVQDKESQATSPMSIIRRAIAGEGVLKVIAESAITPDAWANLHIDASDGKVWAFGRIPEIQGSWREPIVRSSREVLGDFSLRPNYDADTLRTLFGRYMPGWERLAKEIRLFDGGVLGKNVFEKSNEGWKVWENDRYWVEIIERPHLNGNHFVVRPKSELFGKDFQRQWQTTSDSAQPYIQATAEMIAIGLGVDALVDTKRYGQLHISGNWAEGLRIMPDPGSKLNTDYLSDVQTIREKQGHAGGLIGARKREKRRHRIAGDFRTKPHLHVYIPKESTNVVLPRLWKGEAQWKLESNNMQGYTQDELHAIIDSWEKIPALEENVARKTARPVGEGLTEWLMKNVAFRE